MVTVLCGVVALYYQRQWNCGTLLSTLVSVDNKLPQLHAEQYQRLSRKVVDSMLFFHYFLASHKTTSAKASLHLHNL